MFSAAPNQSVAQRLPTFTSISMVLSRYTACCVAVQRSGEAAGLVRSCNYRDKFQLFTECEPALVSNILISIRSLIDPVPMKILTWYVGRQKNEPTLKCSSSLAMWAAYGMFDRGPHIFLVGVFWNTQSTFWSLRGSESREAMVSARNTFVAMRLVDFWCSTSSLGRSECPKAPPVGHLH